MKVAAPGKFNALQRCTWDELEKLFPTCSVMWEVQEGPIWQRERSGPRLYSDGSLYVGGGVGLSRGDWERCDWDHVNNRWIIDVHPIEGVLSIEGKIL
jgi:hypothetical protein